MNWTRIICAYGKVDVWVEVRYSDENAVHCKEQLEAENNKEPRMKKYKQTHQRSKSIADIFREKEKISAKPAPAPVWLTVKMQSTGTLMLTLRGKQFQFNAPINAYAVRDVLNAELGK